MAWSQDDEPIEALDLDGLDDPLHEGVQVRGIRREAQRLNTRALQDSSTPGPNLESRSRMSIRGRSSRSTALGFRTRGWLPGAEPLGAASSKDTTDTRISLHRKLTHDAYNAAWRLAISEHKGPLTKEAVLGILNKLRNSEEFSDWLSKGVKASLSYDRWKQLVGNDKCKLHELRKALQEAMKRGDAISLALADLLPELKSIGSATGKTLSALSTAKRTTGWVVRQGKRMPVVGYVVGPVLFVSAVANGQDPSVAAVNCMLPVSSVKGIKASSDTGRAVLWGEVIDIKSQMRRVEEALFRELQDGNPCDCANRRK